MDFLLAAWNIPNGRLRWISLALAVSAGALAYSLGERGYWIATLVIVPWSSPLFSRVSSVLATISGGGENQG
jgi:hypothetical protein